MVYVDRVGSMGYAREDGDDVTGSRATATPGGPEGSQEGSYDRNIDDEETG